MGVDRRPIAVLPPAVANRIAAGEVIERPAAVVRELIDNSIDAEAGAIEIQHRGGGLELLRVHDDGRGMDAADLRLCWEPHATSKIRSLEDLDQALSLGFRGEALSSIAAVSELAITSTATDSQGRRAMVGHRLLLRNNAIVSLESGPPAPGTAVEVRGLFADLPARRRFLKNPAAEGAAIRNETLDKALAHPQVRFSLQAAEGAPFTLPAGSLVERIAAVFEGKVPAPTLHELHAEGEGFRLTIVAAAPQVIRRDRRLIVPIVNRRRIQEYRIVQAVEFAYREVLHGGVFPAAVVVAEINPELVDFNIHPAKREARIRPLQELHHCIVRTLQQFLHAYRVRDAVRTRDLWVAEPQPARTTAPIAERPVPAAPGGAFRRTTLGRSPTPGPRVGFDPAIRAVVPTRQTPRVLARVYGIFVLVEHDGQLIAIDQHAAHERLIYDRLRASRSSQPLLIAEEFELNADQDAAVLSHRAEFHRLGINLERAAPGRWRITAVPTAFTDSMAELVETISELRGLNEEFDRTFLAEMACKAALKGGDYLDDISAANLAQKVLDLPDPRCPHGRPLWITISKEELLRRIGRGD